MLTKEQFKILEQRSFKKRNLIELTKNNEKESKSSGDIKAGKKKGGEAKKG